MSIMFFAVCPQWVFSRASWALAGAEESFIEMRAFLWKFNGVPWPISALAGTTLVYTVMMTTVGRAFPLVLSFTVSAAVLIRYSCRSLVTLRVVDFLRPHLLLCNPIVKWGFVNITKANIMALVQIISIEIITYLLYASYCFARDDWYCWLLGAW